MSENAPQSIESDRRHVTAQEIVENHDRVEKLKPNQVLEISEKAMSQRTTESGVQSLVAEVAAGDELFAIVRCRTSIMEDGQAKLVDKVAVTRMDRNAYINGERATLLGFAEVGSPLVVGRSEHPEFSDLTSREHFVVAQAEDGSIGIADLESTNGTEVAMANDIENDKFGISGTTSPKPEQGAHYSLWSIRSAELRASIESQKSQ